MIHPYNPVSYNLRLNRAEMINNITNFVTQNPKSVFVSIRVRKGVTPFVPITLETIRDWHLFNYIISEPDQLIKNSIEQLSNAAANPSIPREYLIAQSTQVCDLIYQKNMMRL